ncbi:MAG: glycosyl hydrolase [Candidatus Bathyarchaeota archaeon]|nr:glycosyl hydrolase [Candidatus Bathyarchaeota archaeon]
MEFEEKCSLSDGFKRPPKGAGVKTWWHWMNGNISDVGVSLDLEAMSRVGVIGFQMFQVGTGIPKGPVDYGSDEHLCLLLHAVKEAERLGLEFVMHNCPGWSSSGGPWITPAHSMKMLVWSETYVTGGKRVEVLLPRPYANLDYYNDVCVLAFPSLPGEKQPFKNLVSKAFSSSGLVNVDLITDDNPETGVEVQPSGPDQPAYLQLEFAEPFEARSMLIMCAPLTPAIFFRRPISISLESSNNGISFQKIRQFRVAPIGLGVRANLPIIVNFSAVQAKYFRLIFSEPVRVFEVRLFWAARIANLPSKINLSGMFNPFIEAALPPEETVEDPAGSAINPESVIDVTKYVDGEGRLVWDAPPGDWTVLRIGYTTVGTRNHPAPDGGEGLECDKYSFEAMQHHFYSFFGKLLPSIESLAKRGLAGALIDSYEVGFQNWTPNFPEEFQRRRGYDLRKYLPAMTGRIVGGVEVSERFLWDVRRVQADMMADYYYGGFTELCHKHGMKSYAEPYSFGSGSGIESGAPFDEIQIGSRVDIPMGEFWLARDDGHERSIKLAASIAHIYGKPIVGAESFTGEPSVSAWQEHPYLMKSLGDFMFTRGLNQIIFHTYAHQPHPTVKPGMTMGPFGCTFNRNTTWWDQGKDWIKYLTRCQYMLQQGKFVADILYFIGEDPHAAAPHESRLNPPVPKGYDYDFVNGEAILTRLCVKDGKIVTPDGMSYSILVLGEREKITLGLLRKIRDMVERGMCLVVCSKPKGSPSLADLQGDGELKHIIDELWGDLDGRAVKEREFGKGKVFWAGSLQEVLDRLGIKPDFECSSRSTDALINYIHRRTDDGVDVYFIANRRRRREDLVCTFRVQNMRPEIWNPETGEVTPMPIYEVLEDGRVRMPLSLGPCGSTFVVFRSPASTPRFTSIERNGEVLMNTKPFPAAKPGLYPNITDNFTVSVWVKPEVNASIPIGDGIFPFRSGACWIFYPPQGELIYGEGHAICGLVTGRNGIAIFERSRGEPEPVLVVPMPLEGWTHIALVYRNRIPLLYVNGKLVCAGRKSNKIVHPGVGEPYLNNSIITQPAYVIGDIGGLEVFAEVLNEARIKKIVEGGPPKLEEPPAVEIAGDGRAELLIWKSGTYTLRDNEGRTITLNIPEVDGALEVNGPWRVIFPLDSGAPPEITLTELISLHRHQDEGVKYFSGTATYRTKFTLPVGVKTNGKRIYLDLGRVENIAEVRLNGEELGVLWKPPYRLDITEAVKSGENELEVRVTNVWVNRLIGDEQQPPEYEYGVGADEFGGLFMNAIRKMPEWYIQGKPKPPSKRITFATWKHYNKDSPLLESGLIGPVKLLVAIRCQLN